MCIWDEMIVLLNKVGKVEFTSRETRITSSERNSLFLLTSACLNLKSLYDHLQDNDAPLRRLFSHPLSHTVLSSSCILLRRPSLSDLEHVETLGQYLS